MSNDHDMISVGYGEYRCTRCGTGYGTYSYLQPCPVPEGIAESTIEELQEASDVDPITKAVRESAFDRMDRLFKSK